MRSIPHTNFIGYNHWLHTQAAFEPQYSEKQHPVKGAERRSLGGSTRPQKMCAGYPLGHIEHDVTSVDEADSLLQGGEGKQAANNEMLARDSQLLYNLLPAEPLY